MVSLRRSTSAFSVHHTSCSILGPDFGRYGSPSLLLRMLASSGGKAMQFTVVYNGKRRYAVVRSVRYHSIPHGILAFHTQYRLNTVRDCRGNSKLAVK